MPDPTKEEQFKAAVAAIRELMVPKVKLFTPDVNAQNKLIGKMHETLVASIQVALDELWEAEKNGQ